MCSLGHGYEVRAPLFSWQRHYTLFCDPLFVVLAHPHPSWGCAHSQTPMILALTAEGILWVFEVTPRPPRSPAAVDSSAALLTPVHCWPVTVNGTCLAVVTSATACEIVVGSSNRCLFLYALRHSSDGAIHLFARDRKEYVSQIQSLAVKYVPSHHVREDMTATQESKGLAGLTAGTNIASPQALCCLRASPPHDGWGCLSALLTSVQEWSSCICQGRSPS